ncbi:MAG: TonB-dependent receptor [Bacteroidia bacterium]|nr:TonB-dependent receptor [Bacteroidia bacterium]
MKLFILFLILGLYYNLVFGQEEPLGVNDSIKNKSFPDSLEMTAMPVQEEELSTLTGSELEADEESQDISGLLKASSDIFVSTASYTFSPARFRIRGYASENNIILINGTEVNDMESGGAIWSAWGGLNDATRYKIVNDGISPCEFNFGGVGGATNIITRASTYRKGVKASYSLTNRSYRNRLMLTIATGMMENGVAVVFSGSRRWAQQGYVDGTFYDAWAYFLSAEKKIADNHSLSFTCFGAPTIRGKQGIAVQEIYDLTGNNYYNPNWGFQDGEIRNAKISNYHKPMVLFNHYWNIAPKTSLTSGISYSFGRGGSTALNWYEGSYPSDLSDDNNIALKLAGSDPRPDYYKYLPSYYEHDQAMYNILTDKWENDENFRQLNWDYYYFANSKNLYSVAGVNGSNDTLTGNRSKYIVEEQRTDHSNVGLNSLLNKDINEHLSFTGGINMNWYRGIHFKEVADLLGGDFWVDVDQFAERDFADPALAQNDLNVPNKVVVPGERFGYDYFANIHSYSGFAQCEFTYSWLEFYAAVTGSYTQFWRTGKMKNGKFPDNSFGNSKKQNFPDYGIKAGGLFKITGRHLIALNGIYMTRPPYFQNAYVSPRKRDDVIEGLTNETIWSGDISYLFRAPFLKTRLTYFYTQFNDQIYNESFYHDEFRTLVNYIMTNVDKLHTGLELGAEAKLTPTVSLVIVATKADYIYNSRPNVTIARDNSSELLESRTAYLKNYRIGGTPQTAASFGGKYASPRYWTAGFNVNYFSDSYIDINPDRRTSEAVEYLIADDPQWNQLLEQEKLPWFYTVDIYGFKSWKINDIFINLNLSISNVLGRKDINIGGFEQLRYSPLNPEKFPTKYSYMFGRTYYFGLGIRF